MTLGLNVDILLALAAGGIVLAGVLAPFEALGWWAGWFGPNRDELQGTPKHVKPSNRYIVFLSGIHSVSGSTFVRRERVFLRQLKRRFPESTVLEVFPYSVTNHALTGQRAFGWFWRRALGWKLSRRSLITLAGFVINVRNGWQVAVSTDKRYGPMYDEGSAELIENTLVHAGWSDDHDGSVVLVGYSGGSQIALGAAGPLARRLGVPCTVVSLGGVMASPRSLDGLDRLWHVKGTADKVTRVGTLFFPGRWPVVRWSAWNRGVRDDIVRIVPSGNHDHTGPRGYLDNQNHQPDGRTNLEATLDTLERLLADDHVRQTNLSHKVRAADT
jgi:hypothetical protein